MPPSLPGTDPKMNSLSLKLEMVSRLTLFTLSRLRMSLILGSMILYWTNQRLVSESRDNTRPIRGQHLPLGHRVTHRTQMRPHFLQHCVYPLWSTNKHKSGNKFLTNINWSVYLSKSGKATQLGRLSKLTLEFRKTSFSLLMEDWAESLVLVSEDLLDTIHVW